MPSKFRLMNPQLGINHLSNAEISGIWAKSYIAFIDAMKPLIILDGFDEFSSADDRKILANELRMLAELFVNAKIIVTCRSGEFNYSIEHAETYEIATLTKKQIEMFVKKWLGDENKLQKFMSEI